MSKKSFELKPSRDMSHAGRRADLELAGALLKMIAIGVAGGVALIAGAKKVGDEAFGPEAKQNTEARGDGAIEKEIKTKRRAKLPDITGNEQKGQDVNV